MRAQPKSAPASDKIASGPDPIPLELYRENCQDKKATATRSSYRPSSRISAPQAMRSKTEPRCASSTIACSRSCPRGEF